MANVEFHYPLGRTARYLDASSMISALRFQPEDFEYEHGWLHHVPSRHRFQFDRLGRVSIDAMCGCAAMSIDRNRPTNWSPCSRPGDGNTGCRSRQTASSPRISAGPTPGCGCSATCAWHSGASCAAKSPPAFRSTIWRRRARRRRNRRGFHAAFLDALSRRLGRAVTPGKRGPKPKSERRSEAENRSLRVTRKSSICGRIRSSATTKRPSPAGLSSA